MAHGDLSRISPRYLALWLADSSDDEDFAVPDHRNLVLLPKPHDQPPSRQPSAPTPPPEPYSPFLRLPRELRDLIYFHALAPTEPFDFLGVRVLRIDHREPSAAVIPGAAILRVNKQIHEEAVPVLYNSNRFHVYDHFPTFLQSLSSTNAAHLRHLMLDFRQFGTLVETNVKRPGFPRDWRWGDQMESVAESLPGLRTLELTGFCAVKNAFSPPWFDDYWTEPEPFHEGLDLVWDLWTDYLPDLLPPIVLIQGTVEELSRVDSQPGLEPFLILARDMGFSVHRQLAHKTRLGCRVKIRNSTWDSRVDTIETERHFSLRSTSKDKEKDNRADNLLMSIIRG